MLPGLGLPPLPGGQPADLPPFLRCCPGLLGARGPLGLACEADDGGHGVRGACLQGPGARVGRR